jgi:hypothetical protein
MTPPASASIPAETATCKRRSILLRTQRESERY